MGVKPTSTKRPSDLPEAFFTALANVSSRQKYQQIDSARGENKYFTRLLIIIITYDGADSSVDVASIPGSTLQLSFDASAVSFSRLGATLVLLIISKHITFEEPYPTPAERKRAPLLRDRFYVRLPGGQRSPRS